MASDDTEQPKVSHRIELLWLVTVQPFLHRNRFPLQLLAVGVVVSAIFLIVKWNSGASVIVPRDIIDLNVGGIRFTTSRKTVFSKGPNELTRLIVEWENSTKEFPVFIDRNPILFEAILEYLRTGRYFLPPQVSGWPQLINEIEYFGLASPAEATKLLRPT